ncbi:phage portal protein [Corynebacterium ulcerans]|uniref:phage portal protein n=1 Tax=Corynebacterium ulcerans TaxID=65058 RepID=UPI0002141711|nr:phage portal protein [Corynebacterium ulcerans]AEG84507.1 hypothetical protein CULC22_01798 [Corynebacterium ulcerans BR-AD22]MDK8887594.1 phage portal protein [Corynebacterium ulcerans]
MGVLQNLRDALALPALAAARTASVESPWATRGNLQSVSPPDFFESPHTISRAGAMALPPVARARRIIVSSIARCDLTTYRGDELIDTPEWLTRTDGVLSPYHRMVWTIDDLFFHGWSLWAVERDRTGAIIAADRIPFDDWSIDSENRITWNGTLVADDQVILIPGVDDGILRYSQALLDARELYAAASRASRSPVAHTELHQTGGDILSQEGIYDLLASWARARRSPDGAVSFTPPNIEVKTHGSANSHLLVDGRNAAAVDIARVCGIPAVLLDASTDADKSIKYSNVDTRNIELIDYCLSSFMAPIAARLGMDDVVAPGIRLEFDTDRLTSLSDVSVPDDENRNNS